MTSRHWLCPEKLLAWHAVSGREMSPHFFFLRARRNVLQYLKVVAYNSLNLGQILFALTLYSIVASRLCGIPPPPFVVRVSRHFLGFASLLLFMRAVRCASLTHETFLKEEDEESYEHFLWSTLRTAFHDHCCKEKSGLKTSILDSGKPG